jgi:D-glycero-D-manno-heptose 1,7-bisphosphate phosphatase
MVDGPQGLDSPRTVEEFKLLPGVSAGVRKLNELGLPVLVVSNQPGVAKGKFSAANLEAMTHRMEEALRDERANLQGIYYCMHHPDAVVADYRVSCDCRKPRPGLLVQAAKDMGLDLARSYMVGDQARDVIAGKSVGCTTFLIGAGRLEAKPDEADHMCGDLNAAVRLITQLETERREEPIHSHGATLHNFRESHKATPVIH